MNKKKDPNFEISEIFMAKADWNRCFSGSIIRKVDENGIPFVFSKINVNQGYICSRANYQLELGEMLDELVLMVLDKGLHSNIGVVSIIVEIPYFLN